MIELWANQEGYGDLWPDSVAQVSGADIYAVILYKDGTTEDVGSAHLPVHSKDYGVLFSPSGESGGRGMLQIARQDDMDAILIGGRGTYAESSDWLEVTIGGLDIETRARNLLLLDFGMEGEYTIRAIMDPGSDRMPLIKREAPTLWGRDLPGRLVVLTDD